MGLSATVADRMAKRNGASIHVDAVGWDFKLPDAGDHLGRERLIDLEQVDVLDRKFRLLQRSSHGDHSPPLGCPVR